MIQSKRKKAKVQNQEKKFKWMKWHWYVQIDAQQSIMIKVPLYFFKVRFDTSFKMQTYLLLYLVGKNGLKRGRFYFMRNEEDLHDQNFC